MEGSPHVLTSHKWSIMRVSCNFKGKIISNSIHIFINVYAFIVWEQSIIISAQWDNSSG